MCGTTLKRFQSKDGPCYNLKIEPESVTKFYDLCECGAWNEYRVKRDAITIELVPPDEAEADMVPTPTR